MVTESMVLAEKFVHADTDGLDREPFNSNELGAFVSPDELEEFLRTFDGGEGDEATLQTQGEDDVGGEPTTTVH